MVTQTFFGVACTKEIFCNCHCFNQSQVKQEKGKQDFY